MLQVMTDLILYKETMSSLEIAELTGKRHDAILRDIRNLLNQGVNAHNFVEVEYTDKKGEKRPCYELTKKYGKPKKHYESFSNERVPIDKMRAVNSDICDYASYYFFQNGVIVVSISPFGCVKVSYEDEYNSLLGKQEEEKYRENDI